MKTLTNRQRVFVDSYLVTLNATAAAREAGYSVKTANEQGSRLLANVSVRAAIEQAMQERSRETRLSATYVVRCLQAVAERCMQAEPVLDSRGKPTGVYRFDSAGANRSLELLGKHLGLFTDKFAIDDLRDRTDEELRARDEELGRQLAEGANCAP